MAMLNPLSHAFGIDIGDRAFKLAQFDKHNRRQKPYRLTAWSDIEVPEGVLDRGEIRDQEKAVELLKRLVLEARGSLRGRAVVACLPEAKTFIKIIELPAETSEEGTKEAVLREIEQNIPLPPDDIYFDWQIMPSAPTVKPESEPVEVEAGENTPNATETDTNAVSPSAEESPLPSGDEMAEKATEKALPELTFSEPSAEKSAIPPIRILLAAAPRNLVDNYVQTLELAGLAPIALEIEATAIARALIPDDAPADEAVGIMDIGATRSSLMVFDGGAVQMSISIPISGLEITKMVSEALNVPMADAEIIKRECGLDADRCEDKMWRILLPMMDDMTIKIRNALRFYKIGFPLGKKIEKLCLCRGGALFREIDTVLSRKLTIKVRRGDALVNVDPRLPRGFPKDTALTYATAIGLGLDAVDENEKYRRTF